MWLCRVCVLFLIILISMVGRCSGWLNCIVIFFVDFIGMLWDLMLIVMIGGCFGLIVFVLYGCF